jgi:hypothetical protein
MKLKRSHTTALAALTADTATAHGSLTAMCSHEEDAISANKKQQLLQLSELTRLTSEQNMAGETAFEQVHQCAHVLCHDVIDFKVKTTPPTPLTEMLFSRTLSQTQAAAELLAAGQPQIDAKLQTHRATYAQTFQLSDDVFDKENQENEPRQDRPGKSSSISSSSGSFTSSSGSFTSKAPRSARKILRSIENKDAPSSIKRIASSSLPHSGSTKKVKRTMSRTGKSPSLDRSRSMSSRTRSKEAWTASLETTVETTHKKSIPAPRSYRSSRISSNSDH